MCNRHAKTAVLACLALLAGACGADEGGPICSQHALAAALRHAEAGDVVQLGACRFEAAVTVPAGVIVEGSSRAESVLLVDTDETGVTLVPAAGAPETTLRGVTLESDGQFAVRASGPGAVALEDVAIEATRGVGLGAQSVTTLRMSQVTLTGPVTEELAATLSSDITASDTATHGLVFIDVGEASLTAVSASGFTRFGAVFVDSTGTWDGGDVDGNLATGVMVSGGQVALHGVRISRTYSGLLLQPAYGAVFANGADVETTGLQVSDGDGLGLIHDGATATHTDLVVRDNGDAGVWIQASSGISIAGASTEISGNVLAGVIALDTEQLSVRDARIEGTTEGFRVTEAGAVQAADGIQLVRSTADLELRDLDLVDNERVGLLIELDGGDLSRATIAGVTVEGSGEALGAVVQGGSAPAGWDSGISRDAATQASDAASNGELPTVGLVGPNQVPSTESLATSGLDALVGPNQ